MAIEITKEDGKAPYKVTFFRANGSVWTKTHHKTEKLAVAKAALYPDYGTPLNLVFEPTGETLDEIIARDLGH